MSHHDDLSSYLLGELEPGERERFEQALAADPALAREVERLAPLVTRLDALDERAWASAPPPPLTIGVSERRPRGRRVLVLRPLVAAAVGVALLILGVGAGFLLDGDRDGRARPLPSRTVALEPVGDEAGASGRVRLVRGRVDLRVDGLTPSGSQRYYEVWLLNSEKDLVALGSFRVPATGAASVELPVPVAPGDFRFVDVSLEPQDGDPRHSGQSVLRAPVPRS